jgi:hypothetical protein
MLSGLVEQSAGGAVDAPRRFFVVWQNPETREFHRVGRLEAWPDNSCRFAYASDVRAVPGFRPFAAFPEMEHEYVAERLFPFFANRVMSARRPDFEAYLTLLGLGPQEWTPLEVLARSAGERATDTVQVVAELQTDAHGRLSTVFPASGVRHVEGADERIAHLARGQELFIRCEPDNPWDPRSLLLDVATSEPVGWVPAYLLDEVHKYREEARQFRVTVEQANGPEAPWHLRLLCRLVII